MNRDEIQARLRSSHPLEAEYRMRLIDQRAHLRPGRVGSKVGLTLVPATLVIVVAAMFLRTSGWLPSGAVPQGSETAGPNSETTKPFVSLFPETPAPPLAGGPCGPASVHATLAGWGPAGGTQFVLIRLEALQGSCSLPKTPGASVTDGSTAIANAPAAASGRVQLSTALDARVGVVSLCPASGTRSLAVVLDLSGGLLVTVQLPAAFTVPCLGTSRVTVDDLFAAP